jgi:hypothetical protein
MCRSSRYLDAPGFFTRDIDKLSLISGSWIQPARPTSTISSSGSVFSHLPSSIIYAPSSFPHINTQVVEMVENFIDRMERYLGIRKRIIDLDDAWKRYSGSSEPLSESMRNFCGNLTILNTILDLNSFTGFRAPTPNWIRRSYQRLHRRVSY